MSKFCIYCGTSIAENDKFCPKCGKKIQHEETEIKETNVVTSTTPEETILVQDDLVSIDAVESVEEVATETTQISRSETPVQEKKAQKSSKALIGIVCAVVAVLIIALIAMFSGNEPQNNVGLPALSQFEALMTNAVIDFYDEAGIDAVAEGYLLKDYEVSDMSGTEAVYEHMISCAYGPNKAIGLMGTANSGKVEYVFTFIPLIGMEVDEDALTLMIPMVMIPAGLFDDKYSNFEGLYSLMEKLVQTGTRDEEGDSTTLIIDDIEYTLTVSNSMLGFTVSARDAVGSSENVSSPGIDSNAPIIDDTMYNWEGNDVFATFYAEYHSNTGAKSWEHLGVNGSSYKKPGDTNTNWFDIYSVSFINGTKKYYAVEYGEIQLTDVYEIQSNNSLRCVWSIPLEEYYPWMNGEGNIPVAGQTGYAAYDEKINEYLSAATMSGDKFDTTYDYGGNCSSINALIVGYYHSYGGMSLCYALYDVDENGVPELIFSDSYNIIDIYTMKNGSIVKLYKDCYFGDRSRLHILSDGRLLSEGSSGASSGSCEMCRISSDGVSITIAGAYYYDGNGRDSYMDETHIYISLDEYSDLMSTWLADSVFDSLSWTVITSN